MKEFLRKLNYVFNMITDWLLIVIGALLVMKSMMAIDVVLAKYAVMGAGAILICFGFWYRHRRKKQCRQNR